MAQDCTIAIYPGEGNRTPLLALELQLIVREVFVLLGDYYEEIYNFLVCPDPIGAVSRWLPTFSIESARGDT